MQVTIYAEAEDGSTRKLGVVNTDSISKAHELYQDELRDDERTLHAVHPETCSHRIGQARCDDCGWEAPSVTRLVFADGSGWRR